jgi:putative intracellular protease/amidase
MPARPPRAKARDMDASAFEQILARLVARIPGAAAAILVDDEGEAVDYHLARARLAAFDVRIAAAHWRIVLDEVAASSRLGRPTLLAVRGTARNFYAHALAEGYALVIVLGRRAPLAISPRALSVCERALHREAGWVAPPVTRAWHEVDVATDTSGRPTELRAHAENGAIVPVLELLGRMVGLAPTERGYRVRLTNGVECTLVRERGARWYADEDPGFFPAKARSDRPAEK